MAVMPLVPETKMADSRKQSISRTHWPREPRGQCTNLRPPLQFHSAFLEPTLWREFSINTLIFQHTHTLSLFTFPLTGPTHSLQCDFQREHYQSLILTSSSIAPQKFICHATILLLVTPFRWDFFQSQKQDKFRQTTERNKQTTWAETRSS